MEVEENINTLLGEFGRDLADDDVYNRIEDIRAEIDKDETDMSNMILTFLTNNKIIENPITMKTIERFYNDMIANNSQIINDDIKINKKKDVTLNNIDFMDDYFDESNKENIVETLDKTETLYINNVEWPVTVITNENKYQNLNSQQMVINAIESQSQIVITEQFNNLKSLNKLPNEIESISDFSPVGWKYSSEVFIFGQIVHFNPTLYSNTKDDKFTTETIGLRGFGEQISTIIPLNLTEIDSYSLFPGQNVILRGFTGRKHYKNAPEEFIVREILPKVNIIADEIQLSDFEELGQLNVCIASGPFASDQEIVKDNFLNKLIEPVTIQGSQILVVIGPFIDCNNSRIKEIFRKSIGKTYDSHLQDNLENLAQECVRRNIYLIVVPSYHDITQVPVFPNDSFDFCNNSEILSHPLVHLVSDPATVSIGPYCFAICGTDVIKEMAAQEINKNCTKRLNRLCSHILSEMNFYPIKACNHKINVDWLNWLQSAQLQTTISKAPHVVICPSQLIQFAEHCENILWINPGSSVSSGSYATLTIDSSRITSPSEGIVNAYQFQIHTLTSKK